MSDKNCQMKVKVLMIILLSIPVISIPSLVRSVRSATTCTNTTITNLTSPSVEVFITINSLARVSWDGTFQKRRIELNWVSPADMRSDDFVGLYHDHPLHSSLDPLLRVPASHPGQYYLTSVMFPELTILHPALLPDYSTSKCLYNYYIAYVRGDKVLALNCVKTEPGWMWEMREYIRSLPIHALMIPGTHNSGAYDRFTSYSDDTILMRYSVNQEEDIWTQLVMGVRYLDIRVSYHSNTRTKFWLVHDFVKHNPLYPTIMAVKRFMHMTREFVILDFHRFPSGFDGSEGDARHTELVEYIQRELGQFMVPTWMGKDISLNDMWELNRTLIVTYRDVRTKNKYDNLWTEAEQAWANARKPYQLFSYLDEAMAEKEDEVNLWVAMTHLTPSTFDVLMNLSGGIRWLNNKISRSLTKWYRDIWWQKANIIATDFFLSNNMVDIAKTVNKRRALCREQAYYDDNDYDYYYSTH